MNLDDLTLAHGLVAVGIVLLVGPALFPVQQYRIHDTGHGTIADRAELEREGYRIVAYENLSDRGQELYRRTLENGGQYRVPIGQGAPDFEYEASSEDRRSGVRGPGDRPGMIVVERPPNADLPEADEPVRAAEDLRERREQRREERREERRAAGEGTPTNGTATPTPEGPGTEELRRTITRYDVMQTSTDTPPLPAPPNLVRLLAALGGILSVGVGGYRASLP
jgi:hypothetical protein